MARRCWRTTVPRWAVAFKYPPERVRTRITAVAVTVGKSGKLTPVAEFEPVLVCGTTVTHASLCNQDEIARLGVNIGDEVLIEKSCEIIPKIASLAAKHSEGIFKLPTKCPSCAGAITRYAGVVDYFCPNIACPEQVVARLIHATGKGGLDIDGCGEAFISQLVECGVNTLSKLLSVTDFSAVNIGGAAVRRFLKARESAARQPFWRKLYALCIEGIGHETAQ